MTVFNFVNENIVRVKDSKKGSTLGKINLKKGKFDIFEGQKATKAEDAAISQFLDGVNGAEASTTNLWPLIKALQLVGKNAKEAGTKPDEVQLANLTKAMNKLRQL